MTSRLPRHQGVPLGLSVTLHLVLILLFGVHFDSPHQIPEIPQPDIVQATLVSDQPVEAARNARRQEERSHKARIEEQRQAKQEAEQEAQRQAKEAWPNLLKPI